MMESLLQNIIRQEFDQDDAIALASCLCQILQPHFEGKLFPLELDDEWVAIL